MQISKQNQSDLNPHTYDFTGARITIHKFDTEDFICESKIVEYKNSLQIIRATIHKPELFASLSKVVICIYSQSTIFKFNATIRKLRGSDMLEFALYHGTTDNQRNMMRYSLNDIAIIDALIVDENTVELRRTIEALVLNISRGGILIRTDSSCFKKDDVFRITLRKNRIEMKLICCVVRVKDLNDFVSEYGCQFLEKLDSSGGE